MIADDFDAVTARLQVPESAYIVIVTRGHRDDMRVLRWAVNANARYLGMIGSKRKTIAIYKELEKEGIPAAKFTNIHAPVGLEIGAVTPEEIAVAIVAEMIAERRRALPTSAARCISIPRRTRGAGRCRGGNGERALAALSSKQRSAKNNHPWLKTRNIGCPILVAVSWRQVGREHPILLAAERTGLHQTSTVARIPNLLLRGLFSRRFALALLAFQLPHRDTLFLPRLAQTMLARLVSIAK